MANRSCFKYFQRTLANIILIYYFITIKGFEVCKTFVNLYIEVLRNTMDNKLFNLKQLLKIIIIEIFELLNSFNMFEVFHSWFSYAF